MKKRLIILALTVLLVVLTLAFCSCEMLDSGKGIKKTYINDVGELVVLYTDGSRENLGVVVGRDGVDGADGKDGIDGIDGKNGIDGVNGIDGIDGVDGKDGKDGKDGELVISGEGQSISLASARATRSAVSIVSYYGALHSAGSGVIYKYSDIYDGYLIITNYHVVYDASYGVSEEIYVMLYGNEYSDGFIPAHYIGGSMNYDIAVLFIEDKDFPNSSCAVPVTVADSNKVSIGDTAIAVGNSRGEGMSVTSGVISVDSETIEMTAADGKTAVKFRVMRTDASINKGNSGGGLYNDKGELIGIVSAKIIYDGVEGVGYAIPSTLACNVADNIIDNCLGERYYHVRRALLGITVSISESVSVFDPTTGKISIVETVFVYEASSTNLFGDQIKANDIIKSIVLNGKEELVVTRQFHVIDYLLQARAGDTGTLTVLRYNEETDEYDEIDLDFKIHMESMVDY